MIICLMISLVTFHFSLFAGSCQRFTWNVRAQEEEKNKTTAAGKNTEGK